MVQAPSEGRGGHGERCAGQGAYLTCMKHSRVLLGSLGIYKEGRIQERLHE